MTTKDLIGVVLVAGTVGYAGYYFLGRGDSELAFHLAAQRDTIAMLKESVAARAGTIDSLFQATLALEQRHQADSLAAIENRALERRVRTVERRAAGVAADSLRSLLDEAGQALVTELETSQREVVRTYQNEIRSLERQLTSSERIRLSQSVLITELEERDVKKDGIIAALESIDALQAEKLRSQGFHVWGGRATTTLALIWGLSR